ncbi:MAG: alkaline phosphatase family protein [Actinomycetota bacterium]
MRRLVAAVVVAVLAAGAAAYALRQDDDSSARERAQAPTLEKMAGDAGAQMMGMLKRGNVPGRSGDIALLPKPHFYLGPEGDLTNYETARPPTFTSHPNPWDYLARIPLVMYGPGFVEEGKRYFGKGIDLTDVAPTYARLLGMEDFQAQGRPLQRGIRYDRPPPRLIFTIMIDGGGWNVLRRHPESWPNIRAIAAQGTLYTGATIGSFPAHTGPIHANLGTGFFPEQHGVAHNLHFQNADPQFLERPSLGDLWDEANGNRPIVGTLSVLSNHLAMIGHGANRRGGDRDIGVVWNQDDQTWYTNETYYELPDYLVPLDSGRLKRYEKHMDGRDGFEDGVWFETPIGELRKGLRRASTPAFVRYQGDDMMAILANEELGRDDVTDLFYLQLKSTDQAGHAWNMVNPEVGETLYESDRQIGRIKAELDRRVGVGNYVLMIGADHGQQPLAQSVGGWMINSKELERDLIAEFDSDFTVRSHYVNAVEPHELDLEEVARWLGTYTIGDNIPRGIPGADRVGRGRLAERVFAGAFPIAYLGELTAEHVAGFGAGEWPEGDLTRRRPTGL